MVSSLEERFCDYATEVAFAIPHHPGKVVHTAVVWHGMSMTLMYAVHWVQSYRAIGHSVRVDRSSMPPVAPVIWLRPALITDSHWR